jgi:CPA2 family monovalent cation:H+ antiporter-2
MIHGVEMSVFLGSAPLAAVDLLVVLGTAALVATIFGKLKLETIPGYLLAGVLVGPGVLGLVREAESIERMSGLATVLLMFGIGLHLDASEIRRGMVSILGIGLASTLVFAGISWPIGILFGLSPPVALIAAMALSMSSTAVLIKVLQARRELKSIHGRLGIGISIMQDLLSVVALAVVPLIATWAGVQSGGQGPNLASKLAEKLGGSGSMTLNLGLTAVLGLLGVGAILLAGKYVLPRMLEEVAKVASGELVLVLSAAIALGAGLGTAALGFSPEMGAFLAGFVLTFTPFRYQLSGQISPLRDILMAVFFTVIGLKVIPGALAADVPIIVLGLVMLVLVKFAVIALSSWALGASGSVAVLAGAYTANAGEFTLVVLAGAGKIVPPDVYGQLVAIVMLSLIATPLLVGPACKLASRLDPVKPPPWFKGVTSLDSRYAHAEHAEGAGGEGGAGGAAVAQRVIIAGYGPIGRNVAERLKVLGVPHTVIDMNPRTVRRQTDLGRDVIYGDVTNPEVLEKAGVRTSAAVVLTIPDEEAVMRACTVIRRLNPTIFIAGRTNYLNKAMALYQCGADHVVIEEVATAVAMEREVLAKLRERGIAKAPEVITS